MFSRIPDFFRQQPTQDPVYDLSLAQDAIARVLSEITRRQWLHGDLLSSSPGVALDVSLTTGFENLVEHGLGRTVQGWILADSTAAGYIWRIAAPATTFYRADTHLVLGCSITTTARLIVFA